MAVLTFTYTSSNQQVDIGYVRVKKLPTWKVADTIAPNPPDDLPVTARPEGARTVRNCESTNATTSSQKYVP